MRWSFIALLGLTVALYLVMVLWSLPFIAREAGGLAPFDMRPTGYSPPEAQAFLEALSPRGRVFYRDTQHLLDTVFPPALAVTCSWAAVLLWRGGLRWALVALAIVAAGADLAENHAVDGLLAGYDPALAEVASRWTLLKSGASTVVYLFLAAGLIRLLRRRVRP